MTLSSAIKEREAAEKQAGRHWHLIGQRCWCGFLTVPAAYYVLGAREVKDKGGTRQEPILGTHAQAEKSYLAVMSLQETRNVPTNDCDVPTCSNQREGRYRKCSACRKKVQRGR